MDFTAAYVNGYEHARNIDERNNSECSLFTAEEYILVYATIICAFST